MYKKKKGTDKPSLLIVAPLLLWMIIIFSFSSQPYQQQDISHQLDMLFQAPFWEQLFAPVTFYYHGGLVSVQAIGMGKFLEFFVRKGAHFFIYFVFSFLTAHAVITYKGLHLKTILLTLTFVTIFAATDEFHQMFTEGRTPLIEDVLVDAAGGLLGMVVYLITKERKDKPRT